VRHSERGGIGGTRTGCDNNVPLVRLSWRHHKTIAGWVIECDQGFHPDVIIGRRTRDAAPVEVAFESTEFLFPCAATIPE